MKQITLSLLILLLAFGNLQAQRGHGKMKMNPELKAALHQFKKTEVEPVIRAKQAAFDKQLSTKDLQFIQAKREEAGAAFKKHHALMKEMKSARENGEAKEDLRQAMRAHKKENHQTKKALAESLEDFMEHNSTLIENTLAELKPLHEKWHQQRKAIFEEHRPDDAPKFKEGELKDGPPHGKGWHEDHQEGKEVHEKRRHNKGKGMQKHHGDHKQRAGVKFLLWPGQTGEADQRSGAIDELLPELQQNYPNPASSTTTVEFTLPQAATNVVLTVTNMNGKLMQSKNFNRLGKGQHQHQVEVVDWPKGTYFYTIEADDYKQTKKMMVAF